MSRTLKLSQVAKKVSAGYIAMYPCFQAATDLKLSDASGKGRDATFGSLTIGEAWTVPNRVATVATAGHRPVLSRVSFADFKWNAAQKDVFVFHFKGKVNISVGSVACFGNGSSTATGGIVLRTLTGGGLQGIFYDRLAVASQFTASPVGLADWTTVEHSFTLVLDGKNQLYSIYHDGVEKQLPTAISISNMELSSGSTNDFGFGGITSTGVVTNLFGIHLLRAPSSVLDGLTAAEARTYFQKLSAHLHTNPVTCLTTSEFFNY